MNKRLFTGLFVGSLLSSAFWTSAREFTDTKGRKIQAELVSFLDESVEIKRGNQSFPVPIATFSEPDQKYIREWIAQNPDKSGYRFRFYVDVEESRIGREREDGAAVTDTLKHRPHTYNIVVYNQSPGPVKGVDIRYEIYVNDVVDMKGNAYVKLAVGAKETDKLQTFPGKLTGKLIPQDGKIEFEHDFELDNYVDRDGGRVDQAAADKVIGVRIRVYKNGQVIGEYGVGEDDKRFDRTSWQDVEATEETPEIQQN